MGIAARRGRVISQEHPCSLAGSGGNRVRQRLPQEARGQGEWVPGCRGPAVGPGVQGGPHIVCFHDDWPSGPHLPHLPLLGQEPDAFWEKACPLFTVTLGSSCWESYRGAGRYTEVPRGCSGMSSGQGGVRRTPDIFLTRGCLDLAGDLLPLGAGEGSSLEE